MAQATEVQVPDIGGFSDVSVIDVLVSVINGVSLSTS